MELTMCSNKVCAIRNRCIRSLEPDTEFASWCDFKDVPCKYFLQKYKRIWKCDGCGSECDPMNGPCKECGDTVYTSSLEDVNE